MKTCHLPMWLFSALVLTVFAISLPSAAPAAPPDTPFDIVLKLRNIERTLSLIDKMTANPEQPASASPTAIARGMLQGTDWIDNSLPIVAGLNFQENEPPKITVLIPFATPKDEFRKMVTAHTGPNYYLFSIPPGPLPENIGPVETALHASMNAGSKTAIAIEIPLRQMIDRERTAINEFLTNIGTAPPSDGQDSTVSLSPQETREMMANIIDAAYQVNHLLLGINFNPENIETLLDAEAFPNTNMFKLFSPESRTTLLNAYQPDYPMVFRSRGFDVNALVNLVSSAFGNVYKKVGLDFSSAMAITDRMTGEMTGGFSFNSSNPQFEFITVMKEKDADGTFIESVYFPWLIASGKLVSEELKYKGMPVYEKTGARKIDGRNVYGLKARMVVRGNPASSTVSEPSIFVYDLLLTTVDNYFLTAPNEERLKKLITLCGTFEAEPAPGPLMTADVDMASYVESLRQLSPELQRLSGLEMPAGKAVYRIDLAKGNAHLVATMKTDDLKRLFVIFQKMTPSPEETSVAGTPPRAPIKHDPTTASAPSVQETDPEKKMAEPDEYDSATYWYKRGSFCSTYGNDRAAISYYKKALARDVENADYLYLLGVSYGETGQYQKAMDSIDQAISIQTDGRYYYARGRVLLLSGEKEMAIENFKLAAEMGSRDASQYLEK